MPGSESWSVNGYYPDNQERTPGGGMVILIQPEKPPAAPGYYWLQSPSGTDDDSFYLILRVYVPDPTVSTTQTWAPPKIVFVP